MRWRGAADSAHDRHVRPLSARLRTRTWLLAAVVVLAACGSPARSPGRDGRASPAGTSSTRVPATTSPGDDAPGGTDVTVTAGTTDSTSTTATTTLPTTTTTTAAPAPPTTSPGRTTWPVTTKVDQVLGLELTVTTSSPDIGPGERATFVFRIRNTSDTDHVVYNSNTDFIALDGDGDGDHWAPFCGARPAVLTYADLAPGASIGGDDVAYPGDGGSEPCPRPPPGDYDLVVTIYGCRQPRPYGEGSGDCDDGSWARVSMPVRQR